MASPNKPTPEDLARIDMEPSAEIWDKTASVDCTRCKGTGLVWGDYRNKGYVCPCTLQSSSRPWVPCREGCGNMWCTLHKMHAHDCPCPPKN